MEGQVSGLFLGFFWRVKPKKSVKGGMIQRKERKRERKGGGREPKKRKKRRKKRKCRMVESQKEAVGERSRKGKK